MTMTYPPRMHRLAIALVALVAVVGCSSSKSDKPSPTPTPTPTPAPTPTVPAEAIAVGKPVEKPMRAGEAHRYRIEVPAGNVISGVVMQKGIDVALATFDPTGKQLGSFDSPNGDNGPEPFEIESTIAGAYDIEIRPFVDPSAASGSAGSAGSAGSGSADSASGSGSAVEARYEARVDEIITADAAADKRATERFASPRMLELWRAARGQKKEVLEKFWTDLAGTAPIVEPYPGVPEDVLVTFVMRATTPYVGMWGGTTFREKPMVRIEGSELWYFTTRVPADSRFDYAFIATDGPPDSRSPYRPRSERGRDPRFSKKVLDPNNPRSNGELSRVELPGAAPQPWIVAKPDIPAGKVTELQLDSALLKERRRIGVYTPPGFDPKQRYPLVIAFDGEAYGLQPNALIPLPTILDNLIAAKKIPPVVAALVANQGTRDRDLPGSKEFSAFIAKELVPRMRAEHRAGMTAADTIVTGSSFGGLSSMYIGFHHSDVIGNVLSNSGSFQFRSTEIDADVSEFVEGGALIREFATSPKLPLRLYLDAGIFEEALRDSNRHLRDVLIAKGYPVTYAEFHGSHDYGMWRHTIADGLMALLAPR
jgi:enterochelin esterase-like enzyme